ncbi:MAG: response regulator [Myxococcota bacterium]|nr:response regulator [Myxococcota bacterium]
MSRSTVAPSLVPNRFTVIGSAALAVRPHRIARSVAGTRRSPLQRLGSVEVEGASALVVDPDLGARSLLTAALKREGFEVFTAASAEEALRTVASLPFVPELVLSEVDLPQQDGFALCEALRNLPGGAPRCVILLARRTDAAQRGLARNAGADELLPKPAFVGDILALAKLKIVAEQHGNARVLHTSELPLPQLVRALLTSGRAGRVRLRRGSAALAFRDGSIVDCNFERTTGRRAVERMLALGHGEVEVTFGPTTAGLETLELPELCAVVLPRLRRFHRLLTTGLPLDAVLAMDVAAFARAHATLPHDIAPLARLCDGRRSVRQILIDAPCDETVALEALTRLYTLGAVLPVGEDGDQERTANLVRVLERFGSPAVSRWAASNDERSVPQASPRAVREGLAPELVRQLDAFRIRTVVEPAGPAFEFTEEDAVESEVPTQVSDPYQLPDDELVKTHSPEREVPPAVSSPSAQVAGPAITDRSARGTLLIGAAVLGLGLSAAIVLPRGLSARPAPGAVPVVSGALAVTEAPWFQQAVRLYEGGEVAGARRLLENLVATDPSSAEAWAYLAVTRLDSGEPSAAEVAALRAVELEPSHPRAQLLLGRLALTRGEQEVARLHLDRVIALDGQGPLGTEALQLLPR